METVKLQVSPETGDPASPPPEHAGASTAPWRTIVEHLDDGVVVTDEKGNVVLANPAAARLLGQEVVTKNPAEWPEHYGLFRADCGALPPPEEMPMACSLHRGATTSEEVFVREAPAGRGDDLWVRMTAHPFVDEQGRRSGSFTVFRDVTPRRRVEEALLLHERAIQSSSAGITITDATQPDDPLIYVNDGFLRLTGYEREEVLGRNCRFLQEPRTDPQARAAIREAIEERRPCSVELLNCRKDGSEFWNQLTVTPVCDASGKVTHFIGVQSDITERVAAEQSLQRTTEELSNANARLLRDREAAAKVQQALLPASHIRIPGAEFGWRFLPCEGLAGDLLNVARLDESHVGFYVLDVSGHGTASALLSVTVNRLLSPSLSASSIVKRPLGSNGAYAVASPAQVANELNRAFPWDPKAGQFFTILYAVLDCRTYECRFVSAGHPGLVHVPVRGRPVVRRTQGLPISVAPERYQEDSFLLEPGDRVFLYSDGVTETANAAGELFGQGRLVDIAGQSRDLSIEDSLDAVVAELTGWRAGSPVRDDVSLLACAIPASGASA